MREFRGDGAPEDRKMPIVGRKSQVTSPPVFHAYWKCSMEIILVKNDEVMVFSRILRLVFGNRFSYRESTRKKFSKYTSPRLLY